MHKWPADHKPVFGRIFATDGIEKVARQKSLPRERFVKMNPDGFPLLFEIETYTVAGLERAALASTEKGRERLELEDDGIEEHDLEPIEVRCTPLNLKGPTVVYAVDGRERTTQIPGGARTFVNLAAKLDWEVVRMTYSRGPYLGARGGSLGVSDLVTMIVRGPKVDGAIEPVYGVASWRDAKSQWAWRVENRTPEAVGARALAAWMKEVPRGEE